MSKIVKVIGREIIDSRGNPTHSSAPCSRSLS